MNHLNKFLTTKKTPSEKRFWAISMLSDAQEENERGNREAVRQKINDAKRILLGKYKKVDRFSIEIIRGRIK
jgi:hypothetical protein